MPKLSDPVIFYRIALNHLVKESGRGTQSRLAERVNISRTYMNGILKGRENGPEELREKIAHELGYTYEDMISLGRSIAAGEDPENLPPTTIVIKQKITAASLDDVEEILDRDIGQELLNDLAYLSKNDRKLFYKMATDFFDKVEQLKISEIKPVKRGEGDDGRKGGKS